MSDPMENINAAATALALVAERAGAPYEAADAEIAERRDAYDDLASDLVGVVSNQMSFSATIDPNDLNPTNVDGGIFNSISAAINAAPAGSMVTCSLNSDTSYLFNSHIDLQGKNVLIRKSGAGADPVLTFVSYVAGTNTIYGFGFAKGGMVRFDKIDIIIQDKADPAIAWSAQSYICQYGDGGIVRVILGRSKVTGFDGRGVATCTNGTLVVFSSYSTEFDGPIFGVANATAGAAILSQRSVTLTNGAALTQGGTIGTNILQS